MLGEKKANENVTLNGMAKNHLCFPIKRTFANR